MTYFSMLSLLLLFLLHSYIVMSSEIKCQVISRLMAMEPEPLFPSEAGASEIWNPNYELFQCAGVRVVRTSIQPNGLLLPFYSDSGRFFYIFQGKAMLGVIIPGCSQESHVEKNVCQKIQRIQNGDMVAIRAGEIVWIYNDDNEPFNVIITHGGIVDTNLRQSLFLAGSTKIFNGFSLKFIREAFNIDDELAMKLQNQDLRGNVVYVTSGGLHVLSSPTTEPCLRRDQLEPRSLSNVMEESFCDINTRIMKISDASRADLFIPKIGYLKTINVHQLPILKSIQLSATYHLLLKDVIRLPHWENDYRIAYVIKGEGRIQIVDENGKNVFNDIVKEGQLLIVPKNLVMAELVKTKMFEYIIFKTNANSIISDFSGRNSIIHDLPLKVVTNAYNITEEEANEVKFNRKEMSLAKVMPKYI